MCGRAGPGCPGLRGRASSALAIEVCGCHVGLARGRDVESGKSSEARVGGGSPALRLAPNFSAAALTQAGPPCSPEL